MSADIQAIGEKFDTEKPDWSLLPWEATAEVINVLTFGKKKYDRDNWRLVPDWEKRYFSAAMRHLTAWMAGDVLDTETGCNHLAHAACCILFMLAKDMERADHFLDIDIPPVMTPFQASTIGDLVECILESNREQPTG